jgi:TatD DNase family protein
MNIPQPGDYIDIHIHGGVPAAGIFILESLMAHEDKLPSTITGVAYTFGIHPWFLNENNYNQLLNKVYNSIDNPTVMAVGEAGFDRLRGPSSELQLLVFEKQAVLAEKIRKPLIIHCVRAWDELLSEHKKLKPQMPWMIHGFRGSIKLAEQLLSKGIYLSVWFNFALRPESADLLRSIPRDRIFLETDGADVDIKDIYSKVSNDLGISVDELKNIIHSNFEKFFDLKTL